MKFKIIIITLGIAVFSACTDLNLNPLSEGSSATWYSNDSEVNMALNDMYREVFWPQDDDAWTDDWTSRSALTPVTSATINGEWGTAIDLWKNSYKSIARANTLLASLDRAADVIAADKIDQYAAEARFVRASMYSLLIVHFGDVVYYTEVLGLDESFTKSRTDKNEILGHIYEDYDFAIGHLPDSYGSKELKRATKGAAMAMKARIALYMSDWTVARDAAKACMELGDYELYPDYATLFLSKTKNTKEAIFALPRSVALGEQLGSNYPVKATITRNSGGWASYNPSWELFCSYLCTDGLPIDESPSFNPRKPFENRDPRCAAAIVPFQTRHLGFMYQPHPDSTQVMDFNKGAYVKNNDTRTITQYASYNGLVWNKGVDEDWSDDLNTDPDKIIMRYADVLLMYAEASIELNQIDQSVLDAINTVRARAYGVEMTNTAAYPAVTAGDQVALRKTVRLERRMEFADEGLRYMDIIRWKLADKVLNNNIYGMLDPDELRQKVVDPGLWFFPEIPDIDDDGVANFVPMYDAGLVKLLADRDFDATKQYLWPIPSKEILINDNLNQNTGY